MSIVKDMNPYEKSSAALHVPPEEGVKHTLEFYLFAHFERRYIKNQNITMMDILALLHG